MNDQAESITKMIDRIRAGARENARAVAPPACSEGPTMMDVKTATELMQRCTAGADTISRREGAALATRSSKCAAK